MELLNYFSLHSKKRRHDVLFYYVRIRTRGSNDNFFSFRTRFEPLFFFHDLSVKTKVLPRTLSDNVALKNDM